MKKDIEWLKEEIGNIEYKIEDERYKDDINFHMTVRLNGGLSAIQEIKNLINHLDKPEVLSQEWIDEHEVFIFDLDDNCEIRYVPSLKLQNLLVPKQEITFEQAYEKLREESILSEKSFDYYWNCISDNVEIDEPGNLLVPKQELPVIPNYVAKWISVHHEQFDLYPALRRLEQLNTRDRDVYKWYRENTHTFVNAYLTGKYEVEEEQKYYVYLGDGQYLVSEDELKEHYAKIRHEEDNGFLNCVLTFTEQEIKDYDERFWPFAVKVEEME